MFNSIIILPSWGKWGYDFVKRLRLGFCYLYNPRKCSDEVRYNGVRKNERMYEREVEGDNGKRGYRKFMEC